MKKQAINLTSVTYAIKAQNLLKKYGIWSSIGKSGKNVKGVGCGYSIFVKDEHSAAAINIIQQNKIRILSVEAKEE
ncbi:MAG: DUF3343 domain-containing protein [Oscillospiraceae bacterium]|jgi:hypothetical protein|nr:DUF3343 domain-containing protein [Oscillospiraceae bacterium]